MQPISLNVVFDASTLVGALLREGSVPERAVLQALTTDLLCLSPAVRGEIVEVFSRPKFSRYVTNARRADFLAMLLSRGVIAHPVASTTDCRDPKDNKYLELAWCVSAHCIVSSDADLLTLHPWRGIPIVTPAAYLALRA